MSKQNIQKWCEENNWTEPRQLDNGTWVGFPPGGVIETPLPTLPLSWAQSSELIMSQIQNVVYGLILIIAAVIIGAIALILSPLFLASIVNRERQNRSMP